jgi:hypothetical protein
VYAPHSKQATTNGWALEHRVVMSDKIGRELLVDEHIHHIDGIKTNNSPDNMMIVSVAEHTRIHNGSAETRQQGEENIIVTCACGCGAEFEKYDSRGRKRSVIHGHNRRN